ncbi:IS66 family insertion sequence element accessory protein TnpB, partial [Xenorhabdus sp. PR6a]|nr:IS66 family insertion sequence element accessory protein TnpB [Xenorhabdus sp. PR6a]
SFRNWITDSNKIPPNLSQTLPAILPVSLQPDDAHTVTLHTPDGYAIACPLTLLPEVMRVLARC